MGMQKYDPFALKEYAFTLQKTNKYFTFVSVLISLGIMVASVYLSMDEISHLWIPRSQLPTYITQSNEGPGPFSSTLLCYSALGFPENGTYPSFIAYDFNLKPMQFETVLQADALQMHPSLATMFNESFQCIDLAGLAFTYSRSSYFIEILTELPVALAFQVTSYNDIVKQSPPTFFFYGVNRDYQRVAKTSSSLELEFLFSSAQIADSLWPNADPQRTSTFAYLKPYSLYPRRIGPINNNTVLNLRPQKQFVGIGEDYLQKFNTFKLKTNVSVTRKDIGVIIGTVLGWISTLSFAFGVVLIPILERKKTMTEVECSYVLEKPYRNPSLFRFIVASFRRGIYPKEDVIVQMSEELEERKSVAFLAKVVKGVRDTYPSHVYGIDVVCRADDFNDPKVNFHYPLEPYNNPAEPRRTAADFAKEDPKAPTESDFVEKRKAVLKWLDVGSGSPTMLYGGHGYGSKASFLLTVIFAVGFLVFLQMFGIVQQSTTVRNYNMHLPNSSYELQYNQMTFSTFFNIWPTVQLLDGNRKVIQNLTPLYDAAKCRTYLLNSSYPTLVRNVRIFKIFCLPRNVTLVNSPNPEQTRFISITKGTRTLFSILNQIDTTYSQNAISLPIDTTAFYNEVSYRTKIQVRHEIVDGEEVGRAPTAIHEMYWTTVKLDSKNTYLDSSTTTLFDLTQTVWGLATICFTVILFKIGKYINIARRNSLITKELAEFRESLCILLVKVNALLNGKWNRELNRRRLYLKFSIDGWQPLLTKGSSLFKSAPRT